MRRKRSHPTRWNWGARKGRPWTSSDIESAKFLRHCGLTDKDIGEILYRTEAAVIGKIGYVTERPYFKFYERGRPAVARTPGAMADNFQTAGSA